MKAPVPLEQADDEKIFGGKSVQLGASLQAGLPVPPGWALSVDFVEAAVNRDPETLEVLKTFMADKSYPLAVRSSGVGEDAKIASFAGQHFTELNRIGFTEVKEALHLVWNSGHSEGAKAYRAKLGITEKPRTAVTLQKMVFPDCAGVMFTRHPVTGKQEIVIDASWGLGEAIVEGLVIPDQFRLKPDGTLIEKKAGTKDIVVKPLPGGGTEEAPQEDPEKVEGFCLEDVQLAQMVQLANLCEKHFGPGRDIEWGYENGTLYLLQCRSITVGKFK
ncbi:MAG TPA: PEP/pyruvate-binding domain-containing protein [bacterium]|nr:PEP/pyruvate-binding domain-containing protein [bacterium]